MIFLKWYSIIFMIADLIAIIYKSGQNDDDMGVPYVGCALLLELPIVIYLILA